MSQCGVMANMLCCGHKDPCSIHGAGLWKRSSMAERLFAVQLVIGSIPIVSFFVSLV